mmetsp:Transcript_49821/g.77818  ORF Transcript_49821/g.77818 Transcript_49821/m.77818 type:complete len:96 (-) Transcript_49821:2-289(-)
MELLCALTGACSSEVLTPDKLFTGHESWQRHSRTTDTSKAIENRGCEMLRHMDKRTCEMDIRPSEQGRSKERCSQASRSTSTNVSWEYRKLSCAT